MIRLPSVLLLTLCAVDCSGITSRTVSEAGADANPAGGSPVMASGGAPSSGSGGHASGGVGAMVGAGGRATAGGPPAGGAPFGEPTCPSSNPTPLQPLSSWEYGRSVAALTGYAVTDVLLDDSKPFAPFAYSMTPSSQKLQQLLSEAERQGNAARDGKLLSCNIAEPFDGPCAEAFVDSFVGHAFRRPLTDAERARYMSFFKLATSSGADTATGVELVVEAALMSPLFLYKSYLGDGKTTGDSTSLTAFEVAARLSFLFTGAPPDAALWDAAANGDLLTDAGVEAAARRLLTSPGFAGAVQHFHSQWLGLDELDRFVSAELPEAQLAAMRSDTEDFIGAVFRGKRRLPDLLESSADPQRPAGVLTEASTLVRFNDPTQRGRLVRERLLCNVIPPPPPQIPKTIVVGANQTRRQAWEQHLTDPSCAACHQLMDPIGFGLEGFDELGRFRVTDNGLPVDTSGLMSMADGSDGTFVGPGELATLLSDSPTVGKCVVRTWLGYSLQRAPDAIDDCAVHAAYTAFAGDDLDIGELLVTLVKSPRFRTRDAYAAPVVPGPMFTYGPIEPLAARRKLVLDFAVSETSWLFGVAPIQDRPVLDQYLSSLRDLENQLSQAPPTGG